ncbi:MAG: hypothetical protein ACLVJO_09355 [[Clostridium] scindens]
MPAADGRIARATSDPDVKMMVLDEPTSSLPARQTERAQDYIKKSARNRRLPISTYPTD